jgi:hypothetical protein
MVSIFFPVSFLRSLYSFRVGGLYFTHCPDNGEVNSIVFHKKRKFSMKKAILLTWTSRNQKSFLILLHVPHTRGDELLICCKKMIATVFFVRKYKK